MSGIALSSAHHGPKRVAPTSPVHISPSSPVRLLAGRLDGVQCTPFDAGSQHGSPSLRPSQKRLRAPPPMPSLPALADIEVPAKWFCDEREGPDGLLDPLPSSSSRREHNPASCSSTSAPSGVLNRALSRASSTAGASSDWRMVLYHDRNLVLYNPSEKPHFRSRRLALEEEPGTELSNTSGRCPLCHQAVDARFAFVAQAYFDLLQRLHRNSTCSTMETSEEVDLIAEGDLYRILGLSRSAQAQDIRRAYRKRSLRYHPDKNMDDPDAKLKFQKIAEAFSVLSDEIKRQKYDKSGDMDLDDFDMEQFMNMVNASGLKYQKSASACDMDLEEIDVDFVGDVLEESLQPLEESLQTTAAKHNPFLLANQVPVGAAVASQGGAEEEASAAASLRHLPPGLLNTGYYARFFIETRELGSGSFGSVFLCRHVLDDLALGDYAVKKVPVGDDKTWLRDMIREVKTFERLHHPNIVEYKHSWLELSRTSPFCPFVPFLFILMQYVNGGSLDELIWHDSSPLRPKPLLPVVQIWRFLFDILLGLQHLHRQGILHRDLKPTNILLQWPEGGAVAGRVGAPRALLSDFGTATPVGETAGRIAVRGYTGTVEYTAPELLAGDATEYSEKSDMWSLGMALYAMCFASLPFQHDDPSKLKGIIRNFVQERQGLVGADATVNLPRDPTGRLGSTTRLGSLRQVAAALLAIDAWCRPSCTDLLENPAFRSDCKRYARYDVSEVVSADLLTDGFEACDAHAALPDS